MSENKCICEKCGKQMDEKQFYTYKSGKKTEMCKKCMTMHINIFDPDTYLWLLEKMDVPYSPKEWAASRDKVYAKDPLKATGMAVFGRYLSKMRLKRWKDLGWADSEKVQEEEKKLEDLNENKKDQSYEAEMKDRFERGEITEAQYRTLISEETQYREVLDNAAAASPDPVGSQNFFNENDFINEEELPNPADDLTEEDKIYLAMKWGRLYKPNEWIELEKKYTEMMNSFDIQDSDTQGTLVLICKTYLKMNQAIDVGDVEGYQKLSRVYDSLRKSAKFTAAQNKEQNEDFVDSIGELVAMCEKEGGFIPRFATSIPQDKVDATLEDMNKYVYKLVTQDLGFGRQIEDALRKIQIQKEMEEDEDALTSIEDSVELEDEDYENFFKDIEDQREQDEQKMKGDSDQDAIGGLDDSFS